MGFYSTIPFEAIIVQQSDCSFVVQLRSSLQRMLGPLFFHGPLDGHELLLSCLDPATPAIKPDCPAFSINLSPHKVVNNRSMGRIGVCVHVYLCELVQVSFVFNLRKITVNISNISCTNK